MGYSLTARQKAQELGYTSLRQAARELSQQMSFSEVGRVLGLDERTISYHVRQASTKEYVDCRACHDCATCATTVRAGGIALCENNDAGEPKLRPTESDPLGVWRGARVHESAGLRLGRWGWFDYGVEG